MENQTTNKFIEIMGNRGLEVVKIQAMSEVMMKKFFGKNRNKILEVLVVMRK